MIPIDITDSAFSLDVLGKDAKFSESEFKSFLKNIGEDESGRPIIF